MAGTVSGANYITEPCGCCIQRQFIPLSESAKSEKVKPLTEKYKALVQRSLIFR